MSCGPPEWKLGIIYAVCLAAPWGCSCQDSSSRQPDLSASGLVAAKTPNNAPREAGHWKDDAIGGFGGRNAGGETEAQESMGGRGHLSEGADCAREAMAISAVQGRTAVSPLLEETVAIQGVVIGEFQGEGEELGGFFVQSVAPDSDPLTSEGVFVFDQKSNPRVSVSIGDLVRVVGTVDEYFGLTEIKATSVTRCGSASLPEASLIPFPLSSLAQLEALESMLVRTESLTVTETYELGRYGEVVLSSGGRKYVPNSNSTLDPELREIVLDDGRNAQNVDPVPYLGSGGTLRLGDVLPDLTAVLSYGFGRFRLQPSAVETVEFIRKNERSARPKEVGGDLKVGVLNVLNFFATLGDRGASTTTELNRQRAKLVSAIVLLDADVLGLIEVENDDTALEALLEGINTAAGSQLYAAVPNPPTAGSDAIRSAMIYKGAQLELVPDTTASAVSAVFTRPPVAQTFSYQGERLTVVVSHLKSKGSCPSNSADPDANHGQGCFNALRVEQAKAILGWIPSLRLAAQDEDVVLLGDLNSYFAEDPVTILSAELQNPMASIPPEDRYSYVYQGTAGLFDYALASPSLRVSGQTIWHINADEPRILDYSEESNPAALYSPGPYRSSDHDPVLIGLDLLPAETPAQ